MKVYSILEKKGNPPKELKEKWKFSIYGNRRYIRFAYVKVNEQPEIWSIVECSTGREIIHDVGEISEKTFKAVLTFVVRLDSINITNAIDSWKKKE